MEQLLIVLKIPVNKNVNIRFLIFMLTPVILLNKRGTDFFSRKNYLFINIALLKYTLDQ